MAFSRRALLIAAALLPALGAARAEGALDRDPVTLVRSLQDGQLGVVRRAAQMSVAQRFDALRPAIAASFDLAAVAKICYGPGWDGLSEAQRDEWSQALGDYVAASYAARLGGLNVTGFGAAELVTRGEAQVVSSSMLVADGPGAPIDYVVRKTAKGWRIGDVLANGSLSELAQWRRSLRGPAGGGDFATSLATLRQRRELILDAMKFWNGVMEEFLSDILNDIINSPLESLLYALSILACLYTLFSIFSLRRFPRARTNAPLRIAPGVTILKPLYGAEVGLFDHLASFCRQNYAGPVQIIFGVHDADDAAAGVARKLVAALRSGALEGAPAGLTAELVVDPTPHGANGKVANLINMSRRIVHDIVVLADSDIIVAPDYLSRLAVGLDRPGVGLVTCLYRGVPMAGLWSGLGAMGVDYGFLPNVVAGLTLKLARPCIGATIALRRSTLEAVGGFEIVKGQLADDYMLGAAVRGLGLKVAVADFAVGHAHGEKSFVDLWRQDMRWARTIRSLDPAGYFGLALTFPLAWALLAMLVDGFDPAGVLLSFAALLCRLTLQDEVDERFAGRHHALWLSPLRDLLSFAIYVASYLPGQIFWRGHAFSVATDGAIAPVEGEETEAEAA